MAPGVAHSVAEPVGEAPLQIDLKRVVVGIAVIRGVFQETVLAGKRARVGSGGGAHIGDGVEVGVREDHRRATKRVRSGDQALIEVSQPVLLPSPVSDIRDAEDRVLRELDLRPEAHLLHVRSALVGVLSAELESPARFGGPLGRNSLKGKPLDKV